MSGWNEPKLDELFAAYREALPDREPSAGFTPELWRRIDQRRRRVSRLDDLPKVLCPPRLPYVLP